MGNCVKIRLNSELYNFNADSYSHLVTTTFLMKIRLFLQKTEMKRGDGLNIFDLPNLPLSDELTTILLENKSIKIERIISTGQRSDWYDQDETEFVLLVEGSTKIEFENDEIVTLNKGDTVIIEPHKKHRVIYTSNEPPCIWICVFF